MPTNAELGHQQMAQEIVKQTLTGTFPRPAVAAKVAGYTSSGSGHGILKRNSFFKALWNQIPYDLVAYMQKAQLNAIILKERNWGKFVDEKTATDILFKEGFRLIHLWYDDANNLFTLYAQPNWEYVDKALDKLYKLGGFYAAEKHEHNVNRPLEELSDEELEELTSQGVDKSLSTHVIESTQSEQIIDIPQ